MKSVMVFILILMVGIITFYQPEIVVAQQPECTVFASDFISDCESFTFTLTGNGLEPGWIYYNLIFTPVSGGDVITLTGFVQVIYLNGTPNPVGDENYEMTYTVILPTGKYLLDGTFEIKLVENASSLSYGSDSISSLKVNTLCEPPPPCEDCDGKVTQLTLQYNGSSAAVITVEQKRDGTEVFNDTVLPGGTFTFTGTDKNGTLGTEISIYVAGELNTKIHTSCSRPIGPGLVSGDFLVVEGYSLNGGLLCEAYIPPEPPVTDDCDCKGKVIWLTLQYNGDTSARVKVEQKKEVIVFDAIVLPGGQFTFNGVDKKFTLGTEISVFVDGVLNTKIHTSCSQPIGPGLVRGDFEVIAGESREGGVLCPVDEPPEPLETSDGDCEGKVIQLTLQYNGPSGALVEIMQKKPASIGSFGKGSNDDDDDKGKGPKGNGPKGNGHKDDDDDDDDKGKGDKGKGNKGKGNKGKGKKGHGPKGKGAPMGIIFSETLQNGENFTITGQDDKGTLGTEISIFVGGVLNTKIHTSCSRPIGPGLISGDFLVIEGYSRNGGLLDPVNGIQPKRTVSAPNGLTLSQNYPNPFNPVTTISFSLPRSSHVTLKIYNALGNEVATLVERNEFAGYHSVMWDASKFSSGIYFYRLTAGSYAETKRLMLLK